MISYRMARRSFLRGCGGSAALLLPLLRSIEARAQGLPAPLRFLVIHHSMGTELDLWRPTATATTNAFTLPANSAPFAPLQAKMVMIDGLNIVTASQMPGNSGGANTGEGGTLALMTGVPTLGQLGQQDHAAGGPSIDQILLDRSPMLGGTLSPSPTKTPVQSLQLAADVRSDRDEVAPRVLSYRPPTVSPDLSLARQPLYPETKPINAFNTLFGRVLPSDTPAQVVLAQELSILDFMRADLGRLRNLVPSSERPKLDVHASAIQSMETSLRMSLAATTAPVCVRPAAPSMFPQVGTGSPRITGPQSTLTGADYYDAADPSSHPHQALGRTHLAIIKAAFLCDLVRVATFSWSPHGNWVVFPGTFNGATLSMGGVPLGPSPHHPISMTVDPGVLPWLMAIDRFYSEQTSQAIQEFAAAPDFDGNTLLDNTVIPYVTEVARAWDHNQTNVPTMVFGGKNTRIRGGTFLKVTDGALLMQAGHTMPTVRGTNRPFNDLWLALAPIFGVTLPALGATTQYTGPLAGVVT